MANTVHVTARLSKLLVETIDRQAKIEGRSRNQIIERWLISCTDSMTYPVLSDTPKDILNEAIERAPQGAIAVELRTYEGGLIGSRTIATNPEIRIPTMPKKGWKHNKANCHVYGCLMCKES